MEQMELKFKRELARPRDYYGEFLLWMNRNPKIWQKVAETAMQAAAVSHKIAISEVFERVRWWAKYETFGEDYKLNNNYRAPAVRYLEEHHPLLKNKFEKRRSMSDRAINA